MKNDFGLDVHSINLIEYNQAHDDVFEMPKEIKTDIVLGDLIEIGEHRLLCGDSTNSDQVARLMNGEKADMAHNDPPYMMKKERNWVLNDNHNLEFNREWIELQFMYLKENGSWYCWGIDEPLMDIYSEILKPYIKDKKATFRNLITWDKGYGQSQNSDNTRSYAIADEKCLFVMCEVQDFNNNADNNFYSSDYLRNYLVESRLIMGWDIPTIERIVGHSDLGTVWDIPTIGKIVSNISTMGSVVHSDVNRDDWTSKSQFNFPTKEVYNKLKAEADRVRSQTKNFAFKEEYDELKKEYDELKKEYDELKKEYYSSRAFFNNTHDNFNNVWKFESHLRQGNEGGHATPKPIQLCERAIKSSCPENGLVLDMFLGSGSTMVASHQLKRKCYGMELSPKYCQVIIDRMIKLDHKLKIKINGKDYKK